MKKKRKGTATTILLMLVFLTGVCLLLYPTASDWWNSLHQTHAIAVYAEQVAGVDDGEYERLLAEARAYNDALTETGVRWNMTDEELEEYGTLLSVPNTSVIGYIEISKINCYLPIYHGTDPAVLQTGAGHLEGTSLPVGGESTHTVISGHRGLPRARLFTDLDQLEVGDTFVLYILDEVLTYEVDQILIVEPDDTSALEIVEGEDYCTLLTCTPYGINSHRLLVRGHRTENASDGADGTTGAVLAGLPMAALLAALILALAIAALLRKARRKKKETAGSE